MYWDTSTVSSTRTAAVADGCSLNLADFSRAVVPPPMYGSSVDVVNVNKNSKIGKGGRRARRKPTVVDVSSAPRYMGARPAISSKGAEEERISSRWRFGSISQSKEEEQ